MKTLRSKPRKYEVRLVKKGRRTYGGIVKLVDGRQCYLAFRNLSEIYRSGEKTISAAIDAGTACWALDVDTLTQMRALSINLVGVLVRDTGDIYLTRLEHFQDFSKAKVLNFDRRGGSLQRYLPLQWFMMRRGKVSL